MDRNEFIDLLVSTKNISSEIMTKSKNIDDFPLAFQILKKIEGSDFINLLLNPKEFGQIDLAAGDLNKWCISNLREYKEESKKFIDELAEKVKLNFRFEECEDLDNTQYVLGIDLGTTNTVAAIVEGDKVMTIPLNNGGRLMPSVVCVNQNNKFEVGDIALRQMVINPQETFYSIKRFIGRNPSEFEKSFFERYPFKIGTLDGKIKIISKLLNKEMECEEISAQVILKIKSESEKYLNAKITKCVITVPAYFDNNQRKATRNAASIAGMEVLRIINEPTAAAFAYGLEKKEVDANTLVLDLGGGTFDISLVSSVGEELDSFSVVASLGDRELGGDDFTNLIVEHIKKTIQNEHDNVDFNLQVNALIREEANKAKHLISEVSALNINFPFLPTKDKENFTFSMNFSEDEFAILSQSLIQKIKLKIKEFLDLEKVKDQEITKVVLVGGASRMKIFRRLSEEIFNLKPNIDINPDEVVAHGAAFCAHFASSPNSEKIVIDVNPLSLGTSINFEGQYIFDEIIPPNTPLPTRKTGFYTTIIDNQEAINFKVLQGGRKMAEDNIQLGDCDLEGIEIAEAGIPSISTTFELDEDGILDVKAIDQKTGSTVEAQIKNTLDISQKDIERFQDIALKMADIDQEKIDFLEDCRVLRNWKKFFDSIDKPLKLSEEDKEFIRQIEELISNPVEKTKIKPLITKLRIIIQEQELD